MQELYFVQLKSTYPIEIKGVQYAAGEVVAAFDKIQIANFQEIKNTASANGGWNNQAHIFWESTKEIKISFTQGVFSKRQFALLSNAKLIKSAP